MEQSVPQVLLVPPDHLEAPRDRLALPVQPVLLVAPLVPPVRPELLDRKEQVPQVLLVPPVRPELLDRALVRSSSFRPSRSGRAERSPSLPSQVPIRTYGLWEWSVQPLPPTPMSS